MENVTDGQAEDAILPADTRDPPAPPHLEPEIIVRGEEDSEGGEVVDPNRGKLTGSLLNVITAKPPGPSNMDMPAWDKILLDYNHRAIEELAEMAYQAFQYYPKAKEFVVTHITKRGVQEGYTQDTLRLIDHPSDLGEKWESRRRLEVLIPAIQRCQMGYTVPATNAEGEKGYASAPALHLLEEDVKRILKSLSESIEADEATEKLEKVLDSVASFKFNVEISILRNRVAIEKDATIVRRWTTKYNELYKDWRARLDDLTNTIAKAGAEVPEELEDQMSKIWKAFAENKPPESSHDERGNLSLDNLDADEELTSVESRLIGLEQEMAESIAQAEVLGEEQPKANADLEGWMAHIKAMETLYSEVSKYFLQEVVGRNLRDKDRLNEFKQCIQNHLEARTGLQTRKCAFSERFKEEYDQKKRDREHVARTTLKPPMKDFDGTRPNFLPWIKNHGEYNHEVSSKRRGAVLKKTIKDPRLLLSLDGIEEFEKIVENLEGIFGTLDAQAPFVIEELKNLRNFPDKKGELENIDTILGKRRLLADLPSGLSMFNPLFVVTLQSKLTKDRRNEWIDLVVRGPIEEADKVERFISFLMAIRKSHYAEQASMAMMAHPEKQPKDAKDGKGDGGKKKPVPGANANTTKTDARKCALCSKEHATFLCPDIKSADSSEKLKKLHERMMKRKLCTRCMRPRGEDEKAHSEKCIGKYHDCKEGCPPHSPAKGINKAICFCKTKKGSNANRIKTATVNTLKTNGCSIGGALSAVEVIKIVRRDGTLMRTLIQYDTAAESSCMTDSLAAKSATSSVRGGFRINTLGGRATSDNKAHTIQVKIPGGETIELDGLGVRGQRQRVDSMKVRVPSGWGNRIRRRGYAMPGGDVDLLLGLDAIKWHPQFIDETPERDVRLLRSRLTGKYLLVGNPESAGLIDKPNQRGVTGANRVSVGRQGDSKEDRDPVVRFDRKDQDLMKLISHEGMELEAAKRCVACKGCQKCKTSAQQKSAQDALEEELQRATIHQSDTGNYAGDYVWIKENLKKLLPNRKSALADADGLAKRLKRRGNDLVEAYDKSVQEGFEMGAYRWVKEIQKDVPGFDDFQKHYIVFNYVLNPNSKSTPLRVTKDMSRADANGLSLNSCMVAGGQTLNNMADTVYHIRTSEKLAIGDVSKMFWGFKTPPQTWSLNRFYYKRGGITGDGEWEEACCCTADFGSSGAPSLANCGMDQCVQDHITPTEPELGAEITKHRYMDDFFLVDEWGRDIWPKIRKTEKGLAKGALHFKEWIVSGEGEADDRYELGELPGGDDAEKCLGFSYFPKSDEIRLKSRLNYSKKVRGKRTGPDLVAGKVRETVEEEGLCKRDALTLEMQIFDITGLVAPLVMRSRMAYREILLSQPGIGWDEQLSPANKDSWIKLVEELLKLDRLSWNRSVVPIDHDGSPAWLVVFADGGNGGSMTAAYLRFRKKDGSYESNLISAKGKINPLRHMTIPRVELQAHVMMVRLADHLRGVINVEVERVLYLGDSTAIQQQIAQRSILFDNWVAPRVEEVQQKASIDDFYLVAGVDNPADLGTKLTGKEITVEDVMSDKWLHGGFLDREFEAWPVTKVQPGGELPGLKTKFKDLSITSANVVMIEPNPNASEEEMGEDYLPTSLATDETSLGFIGDRYDEEFIRLEDLEFSDEFEDSEDPQTSAHVVDVEGDEEHPEDDKEIFADLLKEHGDWLKTVRVLALMLRWAHKDETYVALIEKAKDILFRHASSKIDQEKLTPKMRDTTRMKDGILYLYGRGVKGLGHQPTPYVDPNSHLGRAMLIGTHRENHMRSDRHILSKIRGEAFLPRGTAHLRTIHNRCHACRRIEALRLEQIMGRTPFERMNRLSPFESCQVDLAGPTYVFNHTGGRRQKVKAYVLVVACQSTHAVWLTLLEDLSADALLGGLNRVSARFGKIRRVYSDQGTNLVAVARRNDDAATEAANVGEATAPDTPEDEEQPFVEEAEVVAELPAKEQERLKLLLLKQECEMITHSAHAPWMTGAAECLVREMKRRIKSLGAAGTIMTHMQYETMLSQVSCYLNNKPLILLPQPGESLTPNDLLHGMMRRKTPFVTPKDDNLFKGQIVVANNLERWWQAFMEAWQSRLVELSKWRLPHENPTPGSLVLILDRKIGGNFQLGEVLEVFTNEDGVGHVCRIRYTVNGKKKQFERPTRGLAMVMTAAERARGGVNLVQMAQDLEDGLAPKKDYAILPGEQGTATQPPDQSDGEDTSPPSRSDDDDHPDEPDGRDSAEPDGPEATGENAEDKGTAATTIYVVPKMPVPVQVSMTPPDVAETPNAISKVGVGRPRTE